MIERDFPTADNIALCREHYASAPDDELHMRAHKEPNGASGIAAKQLLAERQRTLESSRHAELLAQIKKPHWSATPSFVLLVVSVVLALLALPQVQRLFTEDAQSSRNAAEPKPKRASASAAVSSAAKTSPASN